MINMRISSADQNKVYDLLVIGGGINGVGIANDAAGRGLSVFLCEKDDFAAHTSSASSKLIHGGLRYLEHKEFRLVREALAEREVLLKKAPHIIRPLRFIMPHQPHLRPAWLIRTGLFFYDYLGKRETLAGSNNVFFDPEKSPLNNEISRGFEYSDCAVDDARLVILNAMQAREKGATLVTRTQCIGAKKDNGIWLVDLQDQQGIYRIQTKALVNATGPWVASFIQDQLAQQPEYGIRLVQGSHIIVEKLYDGDKAFILQNNDGRIVFAIPYLDHYTLIGTTDQEYHADPNQIEITDFEIDYLIRVSNEHFKKQISREDIVHTFSGVRPLCDDESDNPSAVTRDYTLSLSKQETNDPVLLSVFGGKLTTYRKLAESAMHQLHPYFKQMHGSWTKDALLPGAEDLESIAQLIEKIKEKLPEIDESLAQRWAHQYGTRVFEMLKTVHSMADLGEEIAHQLYEKEIEYLIDFEWAISAQDILWRRTKLGMKFTCSETEYLEQCLIKLHRLRVKEQAA